MEHLLYLDPGSGSMLLQALIAGFVGVSIFFKNIKMYVLHFFRKVPENSNIEHSSPDKIISQNEGN